MVDVPSFSSFTSREVLLLFHILLLLVLPFVAVEGGLPEVPNIESVPCGFSTSATERSLGSLQQLDVSQEEETAATEGFDEDKLFGPNRRARSNNSTAVESMGDTPKDDVHGQIIQGKPAKKGEYPFFVHPYQGISCAGTLIHEDIVLKATNCLKDFSDGQYVVIGAHERETRDRDECKAFAGLCLLDEYSDLRRIDGDPVPHRKFVDDDTFVNDFMVMKLDYPVACNEPAEMIRVNLKKGDKLHTIGFGATRSGGSSGIRGEPKTLQKVKTKLLDIDDCEGAVPLDEDIMSCAGGPKSGKDSCKGDSGAPLLTKDNVLIGVTSFSPVLGKCTSHDTL